MEVNCPLRETSDFGALGYLVGKAVKNGRPYFRKLDPAVCTPDRLKALGAAMAASGAVALYHVEGVTPEACAGQMLADAAPTITIANLDEGYAALNSNPGRELDLVWLGCPHASLQDIAAVAARLEGQSLRTPLWITAARRLR